MLEPRVPQPDARALVPDPEQLAQLRDVKDSETFVLVPRELLIRFAPRTTDPEMVPFSEA
ncbi:hypothetical protein ACIP3B_01285 [Streptomyces anulatus]|uniref:hypothetical protein n=1 Tax=Streptomyces anulatus TaxID=1892 RepID=UPI00340AE0DD